MFKIIFGFSLLASITQSMGQDTSNTDIIQELVTKCDHLCKNFMDVKQQIGLEPHCQRGCQYFNLEFLALSNDKSKVVDLRTIQDQCQASCKQAYDNFPNKEACFSGCHKMYEAQSKTPFINGWMVIMGVADRNVVFLQPDDSSENQKNWVLLDSMYRSRDYNEFDILEQFKISKTQFHYHDKSINGILGSCKSYWPLIIPFLLLLWFIGLNYWGKIPNELLDDVISVPTECNTTNEELTQSLKNDNFCMIDSETYALLIDSPPKYEDVVDTNTMENRIYT